MSFFVGLAIGAFIGLPIGAVCGFVAAARYHFRSNPHHH